MDLAAAARSGSSSRLRGWLSGWLMVIVAMVVDFHSRPITRCCDLASGSQQTKDRNARYKKRSFGSSPDSTLLIGNPPCLLLLGPSTTLNSCTRQYSNLRCLAGNIRIMSSVAVFGFANSQTPWNLPRATGRLRHHIFALGIARCGPKSPVKGSQCRGNLALAI